MKHTVVHRTQRIGVQVLCVTLDKSELRNFKIEEQLTESQ